jgi:hypothetical protein
MKVERVKILKEITCGQSIKSGEIVDAIKVNNKGVDGYKLFHHTGWYWAPDNFVEKAV